MNDYNATFLKKYFNSMCHAGHRVGDTYLCGACAHAVSHIISTCTKCCHSDAGSEIKDGVGRVCQFRRNIVTLVKRLSPTGVPQQRESLPKQRKEEAFARCRQSQLSGPYPGEYCSDLCSQFQECGGV